MSFYENIFIGRQDLSQQQMEALGANLCLFITQNGGDVVRSEYCGFRNLAYPIKKSRKGHYYIIQLKADGPLIKELERVMRINEDIIRQLTVRVDEFVDSENIISQAKTLADIMAKDAGYRHASDKTVVTEEVAEEVESASTEVQE
ncbi:MAG: 30S ribosomal protein S6 [Holosporaceae bacterium]|nr:30S ribosomal protein S6 [Holosporaceae bacterium]